MDTELSLVLCHLLTNAAMRTFGFRQFFVYLCEEDMHRINSQKRNTGSILV